MTPLRVALLALALLLAPPRRLFGVSAMTDPATGISFKPTHKNLEITGVGVRKKGPIKIYSVGMYTAASLKDKLRTFSQSRDKPKAFAALLSGAGNERPVSFLLNMSMKAGAAKISGGIAKSLNPRHKGDAGEVDQLSDLIMKGCEAKGGAATKGTTFQFDCSPSGVDVTVDGKAQGSVPSASLSKAFCGIYLDDNTVSPALRENCLANWCLE